MQEPGRKACERSTGFLASDGEEIYYEASGEGEAVVFCHGAGGNHASWYQQVPVFVSRYRVVTWDQRGFGRSTNRADRSGPGAAVMDLAALLDHLAIDRAHLVGQSMGGWVILGFALRYPDRVRSLVMANTIGGIRVSDPSEETRQARERVAAALLQPNLPVGGEHPCLAPDFPEREPARAFLYTQISSLAPPTPMSALLELMQTGYTKDDLRGLAAPVLFVASSLDPLFPGGDIRAAAAFIEGARVIEIPASGHSTYFEDPGRWNRAVLEFLRGLSR